ncbi:RNA-directed DNA polymerase, eukaryota, reverse transcriptase zinc-binding domain protein, partial [Tanacetum coccineum]
MDVSNFMRNRRTFVNCWAHSSADVVFLPQPYKKPLLSVDYNAVRKITLDCVCLIANLFALFLHIALANASSCKGAPNTWVTRANGKGSIEEIRENSSVMNKDGIMVEEKEVEDGNAEIEKICNVIFASVSKEDVEKEMEIDEQNMSIENEDVNVRNGSEVKSSDTNDNTNESNKLNNNAFMKTYTKTIEKHVLNKNLFNIPTSRIMVMKWFPAEMRYNIRRMWSKYGLYDIIKNGNSVWLFKFREAGGMNTLVDQSPWMMNGKPLMSVKGISIVASRLGKPLVMDDMTANMCHNGTGRSAFARVLVEMDATNGFKDTIEIQYKNKNNNVIRTKFVKVEFSWKPIICSHCKVFGHNGARCHKNGVKKYQFDNNKGVKVNFDNEGFVEVRNRRYGVQGIGGKNGKEHTKDNLVANENIKIQFKYVPKNGGNKDKEILESSKQGSENRFKTPIKSSSPAKRTWNVGPDNVAEIRKSANKYFVLADVEDNESVNEELVDRR